MVSGGGAVCGATHPPTAGVPAGAAERVCGTTCNQHCYADQRTPTAPRAWGTHIQTEHNGGRRAPTQKHSARTGQGAGHGQGGQGPIRLRETHICA